MKGLRGFLKAMLALLLIRAAATAFAAPLQALDALPPLDDDKELNAGWDYRPGDSPRKAGQIPDWALPVGQTKVWQKLSGSYVSLPAAPKNSQVIWMRVSLPSGNWESPALLIENVDVALEVYSGGKLLFVNETIEPTKRISRLTRSWHMISLPEGSQGKPLFLRIQRSSFATGMGRIFVGSKHLHTRHITNGSLGQLILGALAGSLGLLALFLAFNKIQHRVLVGLGAFATASGFYIFLSAPIRLLWIAQPDFWENLEHILLMSIPASLYYYLEHHKQARELLICRRCWQLHIAFAALGAVFSMTGLLATRQVLPVFFVLTLTTMATIAYFVVKPLWAHKSEQRLLAGTIASLIVFAILDIARSFLRAHPISGIPPLIQIVLFLCVIVLFYSYTQRQAVLMAETETARQQLERAYHSSLLIFSENEIIPAVAKAVEHVVREIKVTALCNVILYIRDWEATEDAPIFRQATLVSQGRLVDNPSIVAVKQRHEATLESIMARSTPCIHNNKSLILPLSVNTQKWGFLAFDSYTKEAILKEDSDFIELVSASLAKTIENAIFLAESRLRAQDEVEMEATSALQTLLLPQTIDIPFAQVATNYQAAHKTGGDWYGYFYHEKRKQVDFFIGDVTGHGIASALLAGVASGAVYALEHSLGDEELFGALPVDERLLQMARTTNRIVYDAGKEKLFMAMLFVSIDLETGRGHFLNSGHQPFYHVRSALNKTLSVMPNPGNTLGYSLSPNYTVEQFQLEEGDLIFLYSAGLFGNKGPSEKKMGVRKFKSIMEKSRDPFEIQNLVLESAREIWQNESPVDDVTTVVLRWLGSSRAASDDTLATAITDVESLSARSA